MVAKDFPNGLGKFTPCFTNVAILGKQCRCRALLYTHSLSYVKLLSSYSSDLIAGLAHTIGILLCVTRIMLSQNSKGIEKYRLSSTARLVHVLAAIAAAANLLLVLFLLNGRIAADTILVVHGHVAPFEWVGESQLLLVHVGLHILYDMGILKSSYLLSQQPSASHHCQSVCHWHLLELMLHAQCSSLLIL